MSAKCVVCDDSDQETVENPIYVCEDCCIGVHKYCYGITWQSDNAEPWWCSPCGSGKFGAVCELCTQSGGALKKTTDEKWVHVICALFIQGTTFTNKNRMEPVNTANVLKKNRDQKCIFCSKVCGVCCQCSDPSCSRFLHVTCGQKYKCLVENINPKTNKIGFEAYCRQHNPNQSARRISSAFVLNTLAAKDNQHQTDRNNHVFVDTVNISSDACDESHADVSHSVINESNDGKSVTESVADSFNHNIGASSTLYDSNDSKTNKFDYKTDNDVNVCAFESGLLNVSYTRVTNNHQHQSTSDADAADAFWWDYYSDWKKREDELVAHLHSKDTEITKVKNIFKFNE